jgi:hypothetical protein
VAVPDGDRRAVTGTQRYRAQRPASGLPERRIALDDRRAARLHRDSEAVQPSRESLARRFDHSLLPRPAVEEAATPGCSGERRQRALLGLGQVPRCDLFPLRPGIDPLYVDAHRAIEGHGAEEEPPGVSHAEPQTLAG